MRVVHDPITESGPFQETLTGLVTRELKPELDGYRSFCMSIGTIT